MHTLNITLRKSDWFFCSWIIFLLCSSNFILTFGFEFSPIGVPLLLVFFILNRRTFYYLSPLLIVTLISIPGIMILGNFIELVKELVFILTMTFGWYIQKEEKLTYKSLYIFAHIIFSIAMLQTLIPQISEVLSMVLSKSVSGGIRGVPSIFSEPSYFAALASLLMIYFVCHNNKKNSRYVQLLLLLSLLLSKSTMAIFGIFIFVIYSNYSPFLKIIVLFLATLYLSMFSVEINARLFFIVRNILINGVPSILDESLSARLYYIIRDINFSHDFYYFNVFGLSTYHNLVVELHSPENVPSLLRYDPFLSGSMLGRFVVQFGITLIIAILYYVHTMIRQKIMKRMFCLGTIVLITLQMISLMFIPFGIVLGCVLSTLRKQRI